MGEVSQKDTTWYLYQSFGIVPDAYLGGSYETASSSRIKTSSTLW
jgi:hypothetical protein